MVPRGEVDGDALGDDDDNVGVGDNGGVGEEEFETVGLADGVAVLPDPADLAKGENAMQTIPITITTSPGGPVTMTLKGPWNVGNLSESER